MLGGRNNRKSIICVENQGSNQVENYEIVLNENKYTEFRISWDEVELNVDQFGDILWMDRTDEIGYDWI